MRQLRRAAELPWFALVAVIALVGCSKEDEGETDGPSGHDRPLQYAPVVQFENIQFEGFPVKIYVPPDPIGLVWGFHGSNGGLAYMNEIETTALLNELVLEGFAFAGTESTERTGHQQWDTEDEDVDTNLDLQRLFALREHLIETTGLEPGVPEFAFGFSNGGAMTATMARASLAHGIDFRATAPHLSNGNAQGLDIPVIWSIAVNDPMPGAEPEHERRLEDGLVSELHVIPELKITEDYFTKNPTIDIGRSKKTYEEMVRLELIAADGTRLAPVDEAEAWFKLFEKQAKITSPSLRTEEIRVAWALHRMNGYYAREVRDFFLDAL